MIHLSVVTADGVALDTRVSYVEYPDRLRLRRRPARACADAVRGERWQGQIHHGQQRIPARSRSATAWRTPEAAR
ncbi:MAG: hypothetical protein V8S72_08375 [Oscillospiraceae bacterium]